MAYEIPQQLKYEEKVLFGLTLEQFAYIAVFGLLSAAIYLRFNIVPEIKYVLLGLTASAGLGFAFFDFKGHIKNLMTFYQGPRNEGYLDEKCKNFVEIKAIKDDMLRLKNGEARSIVQVFPINFAIKSETEQEAIIMGYQSFLNSLTFPIQILMRTVNLNIDNYMDNLDKTTGKTIQRTGNESLRYLFNDYKHFMDKFIAENAIQDRMFYVVVPVKTNVKGKDMEEQLLSERDIATNLITKKLSEIGLKTRVLSTQQLTSLMASFFEGYIEVENDYMFPMTILEKYKEADSYD